MLSRGSYLSALNNYGLIIPGVDIKRVSESLFNLVIKPFVEPKTVPINTVGLLRCVLLYVLEHVLLQDNIAHVRGSFRYGLSVHDSMDIARSDELKVLSVRSDDIRYRYALENGNLVAGFRNPWYHIQRSFGCNA